MSKVICEICGTSYPETADSCPICGYSRDLGAAFLDDDFLLEEEYLQGRVLRWCLEQAAGSKKDLTAAHIHSVRELLLKKGNGQVHLPYELIVYKKYDLGMIERKNPPGKAGEPQEEEKQLKEYLVSLPNLNKN